MHVILVFMTYESKNKEGRIFSQDLFVIFLFWRKKTSVFDEMIIASFQVFASLQVFLS